MDWKEFLKPNKFHIYFSLPAFTIFLALSLWLNTVIKGIRRSSGDFEYAAYNIFLKEPKFVAFLTVIIIIAYICGCTLRVERKKKSL